MNIVTILKDWPIGTSLYCPLYGIVYLDKVYFEDPYPIKVICRDGSEDSFTAEGKYYRDYLEGECVLFPSKDERDWNKIKCR